jgi:hypothetical protein
MIVRDEGRQNRDVVMNALEEELARKETWVKGVLAHQVLIDPAVGIDNAEKQAGKYLTTNEFEMRLRKLNPNLFVEPIEGNPKCKRLSLKVPEGLLWICTCSVGRIPEYSLFDTREEEVIDTSLRHVNRKDLPTMKPGNLEYDSDTGDFRGEAWVSDPEAVRPGILRVKRPWHELVRGWRTVLAHIVQLGINSPEEVERVFGGSDRLSWAARMGKQDVRTLY